MVESIDRAREALKLHLCRMVKGGYVIPYPTPLDLIDVPEGGFATIIEVNKKYRYQEAELDSR